MITVTLELTPEVAAGLLRFADKVSHEQAHAVLYPHVKDDIRSEQASQIIAGFGQLGRALGHAGAKAWPWVECGRAD